MGVPSSISRPLRCRSTVPYTIEEGTGLGSMHMGIFKSLQSSSSQQSLSMSNSMVREALE